MKCDECRQQNAAVQTIPYIAYEAECARHDRKIKQIVVSFILTIALMVMAFVGYLVYDRYVDSQYEWVDESIELTTRGGGNASYIGNDGDINNYGNYPSETQNP